MRHLLTIASMSALLALVVPVHAADDDRATLGDMLDAFLAGASLGDPAVHERFWADDLVYTSSNGTRTDKTSILEGVRGAADDRPETPAIVYSADQVDVRIYGDMAVVAFRLVATPTGDGAVQHYFNTGTFLKRGGEWRAVAWQATRIPPEQRP